MNTVAERHASHTSLNSEILFLQTELKFLLKLVNREYGNSINMTKIKVLDSYYMLIEKNITSLNELLKEIKNEENTLKNIYSPYASSSDTCCLLCAEERIIESFRKTTVEIRTVKESLYDYIINNK